ADTYGLAFLKSQEATSTSLPLEENGIECESVKKVHEGRPNIVDAIKNGDLLTKHYLGGNFCHGNSGVIKKLLTIISCEKTINIFSNWTEKYI
ncbi:MAG TPA: hypothetical protein ENI20_06140, partial [Bacteroides sp.]|nr:hypothetical protein [Bacteroides sp.]